MATDERFQLIIKDVGSKDLSFGEPDIIALRLDETLTGLPDSDWAGTPAFGMREPLGKEGLKTPFSDMGATPVGRALGLVTTEAALPFRLRARLRLPVDPVEVKKLLNRPAILRIGDVKEARYLHGQVIQARNLGAGSTAERAIDVLVLPWLAYLGLTKRAQVWQGKTVDIVRQVLQQYPADLTGPIEIETSGVDPSLPSRNFVLQYQESDLDFVYRILERDGIYCYVRHQAENAKLILSSSNGGLTDAQLNKRKLTVEQQPGAGEQLFGDLISNLAIQTETVPQKVIARDFNPKNASATLQAMNPSEDKPLTVLAYPGGFDQLDQGLDRVAKQLARAFASYEVLAVGESRCQFMAPGEMVQLPNDKRLGLPAELDNGQFFIRRTRHDLIRMNDQEEPTYVNRFEAMALDREYRPARLTPVPRAYGATLANVVVASEGAAADVEGVDGVLIQFLWDDAKVKLRARLGQGWAGQKRGAFMMPRPGDEVIVSFVEGEIDRPVVIGSLHNSDAAMAFDPHASGGALSSVAAPAAAALGMALVGAGLSGASDSSSELGRMAGMRDEGGNALSLYDKPGSERVMIAAAKDRNDLTAGTWALASSTKNELVVGDFTLKIGGNFNLEVAGNTFVTLLGNHTMKIGA